MTVDPQDYLKLGNELAGLAALVNGLLLWPIVKSLKAEQLELKGIVKKILLSLRITAPKKKQLPKKKK